MVIFLHIAIVQYNHYYLYLDSWDCIHWIFSYDIISFFSSLYDKFSLGVNKSHRLFKLPKLTINIYQAKELLCLRSTRRPYNSTNWAFSLLKYSCWLQVTVFVARVSPEHKTHHTFTRTKQYVGASLSKFSENFTQISGVVLWIRYRPPMLINGVVYVLNVAISITNLNDLIISMYSKVFYCVLYIYLFLQWYSSVSS